MAGAKRIYIDVAPTIGSALPNAHCHMEGIDNPYEALQLLRGVVKALEKEIQEQETVTIKTTIPTILIPKGGFES
jgi:hypothetical protein